MQPSIGKVLAYHWSLPETFRMGKNESFKEGNFDAFLSFSHYCFIYLGGSVGIVCCCCCCWAGQILKYGIICFFLFLLLASNHRWPRKEEGEKENEEFCADITTAEYIE